MISRLWRWLCGIEPDRTILPNCASKVLALLARLLAKPAKKKACASSVVGAVSGTC